MTFRAFQILPIFHFNQSNPPSPSEASIQKATAAQSSQTAENLKKKMINWENEEENRMQEEIVEVFNFRSEGIFGI